MFLSALASNACLVTFDFQFDYLHTELCSVTKGSVGKFKAFEMSTPGKKENRRRRVRAGDDWKKRKEKHSKL